MKYYIHTKDGRHHQPFDTFEAAWDLMEWLVPIKDQKEVLSELYVIGSEVSEL